MNRRTEKPLKYQAIGLIMFLAVCYGAAAAGGLATHPRIENWYADLAKPSWTPPDWVFAPVWTFLYASMAVAAWLVWRQNAPADNWLPLGLFALQLALNVGWSWLFFGLKDPALAFVDIILLTAAIAATLAAFWRQSAAAGLPLAPYLGWVTFAAALNFAIWRLNV